MRSYTYVISVSCVYACSVVMLCVCVICTHALLRHSALYKALIDHTICCVLCCPRIIIFLIRCMLLSL